MARYSAKRIRQIIIASLLATLCAFVAVWIAIYLLNITERFFSPSTEEDTAATSTGSKVELLEQLRGESTTTDEEKHDMLDELTSTSSTSSEEERLRLLDELNGS
jgi:hypothetical protein